MRPVLYQWDGEAMRPVGRMQALADEQFVPGERYTLEVSNTRSQAEHRQFFAWVNEAWANLPEYLEGRWSDPERLRKWALIRAGICKVKTYHADTLAEAERHMRSEVEDDDEVEIERDGCVVVSKTAKSQSLRAMTAAEFRASKEAVVAIVSMLIGVTSATLKRESQRHA